MPASPDPADLAALAALARHRTLSAAARRSGVAISTISRRIAALEAATGLALVDRRNRGAVLTEAGRRLAEAAEPLASQLDRVTALAASLRGGRVRRPVRLSATEFVIAEVLGRNLGALQLDASAPDLVLQSEAEVISLAAREADLAVRMVRPEGASLIIRKLPAIALSLHGSRDYLAGRETVRDLSAERLISYDDTYGPIPETAWIERLGLGAAVTLRSGSIRAQLNAARAGIGLTLLPDAVAARYPELVRIEAGPRFPPRQPWLAVHRDLQRDPAVRQVADWVVGCFRNLLLGSTSNLAQA
jgi:DNA-binding transcriptional LysR family regulator